MDFLEELDLWTSNDRSLLADLKQHREGIHNCSRNDNNPTSVEFICSHPHMYVCNHSPPLVEHTHSQTDIITTHPTDSPHRHTRTTHPTDTPSPLPPQTLPHHSPHRYTPTTHPTDTPHHSPTDTPHHSPHRHTPQIHPHHSPTDTPHRS